MKAHRVWLAVSSLLLTSWAPSAIACDLAQSRIVFPNLGTHIAWYCKATDAEKRQAIDLALKASCVPAKLKELGKPPIAKEATDVIPYWYTKLDAEKAGPILEVRITTTSSNDNNEERKTGFRVLATGRKIMVMPPPQTNPAPSTPAPQPVVLGIQFDIGDPSSFEHYCPATGCSDKFADLCTPPSANTIAGLGD